MLAAAQTAYRVAAAAYLRTEASRWDAQLRLDVAIRDGAAPATIRLRQDSVWATVAALAAADDALTCAETTLLAVYRGSYR